MIVICPRPKNPHFPALLIMGFLLIATACTAQAGEAVTLQTSDGVTVYATVTQARPDNGKILLLFHQANGNRQEYAPLVAKLTALGYDTLAIDQRSGGNLFGGRNKTVAERGKSGDYIDALPDLEAALEWAESRDYETIVAVGSSYSASLVILLAARHPQEIEAVASFSPGEYFQNKDRVKNAAAKISMPFYITTDPSEAGNVAEVLSKTHASNITRYKPRAGVHGASTLVASRDPAGYKKNLASFAKFLRRIASVSNAHH